MNPETRTHDKHWIPWIKRELENNGINVEVPLMPEPWMADYNEWKKVFDKLIVNVDTILIGHSCGCAFLVRWLGETKRKVKKLILVAPWKIPYGTGVYFDSSKKFYDYNIDESIVKRAGEIIMFTADDEEEDGKKSLRIYHENLKGKVIELKNHGHYTFDDMGTEEFPELLEIVLK